MEKGQKIAIIGTGIAGLGAAWLLHNEHNITVYEQNSYSGGHSNTVLTQNGTAVDTGFIVYNPPAYPNFAALMKQLGVATQPTSMSFAVSLNNGKVEYSGDSAGTFFAQRKNFFKARFHRLWFDIMCFNYEAKAFVKANPASDMTLGEYMKARNYGYGLFNYHLLPMGGAIWSMSKEAMKDFPLVTFVKFFESHSLLQTSNHPVWRSVKGGSKSYVEKLTEPFKARIRHRCGAVKIDRAGAKVIILDAKGEREGYDQVVIAAHADEALAMLAQPTEDERKILGAIKYSKNRAVLHQDETLMPKLKRAWASWNYLGTQKGPEPKVSLVYWMNKLQSLPAESQYFVSLNPLKEPARPIFETTYTHPVFNKTMVEAQADIPKLQGVNRTWFCGAYCGYGFHEDALASGLAVAEHFGVTRPWQVKEASTAAANTRKAA